MLLGEAGGLSRAQIMDVVGQSAVASPLLAYKRAAIVEDDFTPAFSVEQMIKDFTLICGAANREGLPMFATGLILQQYHAAAAAGYRDADFFALMNWLRAIVDLGNRKEGVNPRSKPSKQSSSPVAPARSPLSHHELNRIIAFLRSIRNPLDRSVGGARPDPYWNVVLALVESHLEDPPDGPDRAHRCQRRGLRHRQPPRRENGRGGSYCQGASRAAPQDLISPAERGAVRGVRCLRHRRKGAAGARASACARGRRPTNTTWRFLLCSSDHRASHRRRHRGKGFSRHPLPAQRRQLLYRDAEHVVGLSNGHIPARGRVDLRPLPDLYEEALRSLTARDRRHDIVAPGSAWLGRFAEAELIAPLDDEIARAAINPLDFHPTVWATGHWNGRQYEIPIYCTIEILAARRDLFERAGFDFPPKLRPDTRDRPRSAPAKKGRFGIAWNGARGMPIASSFMLMLASAGSSIVELPRRSANWVDGLDLGRLRPQIDTEAGRKLDYMRGACRRLAA